MRAKPRATRAICKLCGKEMGRNQVIKHWEQEHPKELSEKRSQPGGLWGSGRDFKEKWYFLAEHLPGEVI